MAALPASLIKRSNVIVSNKYPNDADEQLEGNSTTLTGEDSSSSLKTLKREQSASKRKVKALEKKFLCEQCNKAFRHKSYYEYHLRTHSGDRPFQCGLCKKAFFECSKLNRHLSECHKIKNVYYEGGDTDDPLDPTNNTCPTCQKNFSRNSHLQAHLLTHEGARPFTCKVCMKTFSGLTALKNHEKSHTGTKSILCDICGKAFLLKKYLDLHLRTTHKLQERKHKCPNCIKEFHTAKELKRHQLMHSNLKNFECSLCGTCFKRNDNLNRHLKLTHSVNPEENKEKANQNSSTSVDQTASNSSSEQIMSTPATRQVSVIKSTHEVMMSMTRGQCPSK